VCAAAGGTGAGGGGGGGRVGGVAVLECICVLIHTRTRSHITHMIIIITAATTIFVFIVTHTKKGFTHPNTHIFIVTTPTSPIHPGTKTVLQVLQKVRWACRYSQLDCVSKATLASRAGD
jgi:hypothetical protein